jgi:hypothetical protein
VPASDGGRDPREIGPVLEGDARHPHRRRTSLSQHCLQLRGILHGARDQHAHAG